MGDKTVTVIDHGWHTDIGIPAGELSGPLAVFRAIFPGARAFVFSYGKRTFITAPADDWAEYVLGPIPGPAAILVTGLGVQPDVAYQSGEAIVLPITEGGAAALSAFIWRALAKDPAGHPKLIERGPFEGSLFYGASATYTLAHTCNAWSAEALAAAGVPITADGVVLAHQVMDRVRQVALCPLPHDATRRPGGIGGA